MTETPDLRRNNGIAPSGRLQPSHPRAVRALRAIQDGRLQDADENVDAIPDTPSDLQAWKAYVRGLVAAARNQWGEVETLAQRAVSLAVSSFLVALDDEGHRAERLVGCVFELVGLAYRRQDRPGEAYTAHGAAYRIREKIGSTEELWETAISLGLDAVLWRKVETAVRWFRIAAEVGTFCDDAPLVKAATAYSHISSNLMSIGAFDDAIAASRTACELYRRHDPGSADVPVADLGMGKALLRKAEALQNEKPKAAISSLHEAIDVFHDATESLAAFGPAQDHDYQRGVEQWELARRLLASLHATENDAPVTRRAAV